MSSEPRRRRHHTRSRGGCYTCKDRHIRCDELRPVCTNCLTRGGDCGYPEADTATRPAARGRSSSSAVLTQSRHASPGPSTALPGPSTLLAATPTDPFGTFPVKMPHKSHMLFHHFSHFRIMNRMPTPKNPNNFCVALAMNDPTIFHGALLLAGMHWYWVNGDVAVIQETYLYHKLEAIRLVNEQIAETGTNSSDSVIGTIACLALAESGMGNFEAADTHLRGFYSLLDMTDTSKWERRLHGLPMRMVLLAGSILASSPLYGKEGSPHPTAPTATAAASESNPAVIRPGPQPSAVPLFARQPGPIFTTCPLNPTKLSPFYYKSPPDIEACNRDLEAEVMIISLRRLSELPIFDTPNGASDDVSTTASPWVPSDLSPEERESLLKDTEAFVGTFLSRPDQFGYPSLDPAVGPDSTRTWAVACYFYLQMVLRNKPIDANLMLWLLDQLRGDIARTEEAMAIGAYSRELYLWKTVLGNLALEVGSRMESPEPAVLSELQEWYPEQLRLAFSKFDLGDWHDLKAVLAKVAWIEDFAGDAVVRDQWRAATHASKGKEAMRRREGGESGDVSMSE